MSTRSEHSENAATKHRTLIRKLFFSSIVPASALKGVPVWVTKLSENNKTHQDKQKPSGAYMAYSQNWRGYKPTKYSKLQCFMYLKKKNNHFYFFFPSFRDHHKVVQIPVSMEIFFDIFLFFSQSTINKFNLLCISIILSKSMLPKKIIEGVIVYHPYIQYLLY